MLSGNRQTREGFPKYALAAVLVTGFAAFAWYLLPNPPRAEAEQPSGGHASHPGDPTALADGVVLSVDSTAKSVTIRHGPLYNLGMPPMAMEFRIGVSGLLEGIKVGDKVRFHADVIGGAFTVMTIEPAK